MVKCTHKGCGKEFKEKENKDNACQFHEGAPVFHEGLKGWSCCKKRVSDFDEFLAIPGCAYGRHSTEPVAATAPVNTAKEKPVVAAASHITKDGVEVYGKPAAAPAPVAVTVTAPEKAAQQVKPVVLEDDDDDESVPVPEGTICKRRGCGRVWKDASASRGNGTEAICHYHPGSPIFHEGSKGWSCCTRKVLDFDEFLKIEGCKKGKHLFIGSQSESEELVDCRTDWYQTQTNIILSIFAKNKEYTKVNFGVQSLDVDIKMKGNKRYKKIFPLFTTIDPEASKFTVLSTKLEINLKKTSGISWPSLEYSDNVTTFTTFGVSGGGGTVGGKTIHYNADSPLNFVKK